MHTSRRGMSLTEILVVIAIIGVLAAIVLPAISVLRERAKEVQATSLVMRLRVAMDGYRASDNHDRWPMQEVLWALPAATPMEIGKTSVSAAYPDGLIGLIDLPRDEFRFDPAGLLLDPWDKPYRYHLKRPAPAAGSSRFTDWNWDADNNRERAWNSLASPPAAAPFPYVWSLGPTGDADDATEWIYATASP